jgi:hypothetical protein
MQGPSNRSSRPHPLFSGRATAHKAIVFDIVAIFICRTSRISCTWSCESIDCGNHKLLDISVSSSKNNQACGGQG